MRTSVGPKASSKCSIEPSRSMLKVGTLLAAWLARRPVIWRSLEVDLARAVSWELVFDLRDVVDPVPPSTMEIFPMLVTFRVTAPWSGFDLGAGKNWGYVPSRVFRLWESGVSGTTVAVEDAAWSTSNLSQRDPHVRHTHQRSNRLALQRRYSAGWLHCSGSFSQNFCAVDLFKGLPIPWAIHSVWFALPLVLVAFLNLSLTFSVSTSSHTAPFFCR